MIIRQETPEDYDEIYQLVQKAFETADVKDGDEQDYVNALRKSQKYIPELALVAIKDDHIVGHIMLTKMLINEEKNTQEQLVLSPISVQLEYRLQGIARALIEKSLERAKEMGYAAVFLCGAPEFYHKIGFRETTEFGIFHKNKSLDRKFVMVRELVPGALSSVQGMIDIV